MVENELLNVTQQTPIEIALDIDSHGETTAKKLYAFLELNPRNYSHWVKRNITDNDFAEEDVDYKVFVVKDENPKAGGRPTVDYRITAHFAKKLSMKGDGEKAEQAREYFTQVEERAKEKAIEVQMDSTDMQILMQNISAILTQTTTKMVEAITALSDRVEKLEQRRLPQGKPDGDTWYDNNCNKIFNAAEKKNSTAKHIIHLILLELRKSYDIDYAMELYEQTTGSKPTYALEIIESYPNMQRTATNFLNSILIEKPKVYEKEEIFQFK